MLSFEEYQYLLRVCVDLRHIYYETESGMYTSGLTFFERAQYFMLNQILKKL